MYYGEICKGRWIGIESAWMQPCASLFLAYNQHIAPHDAHIHAAGRQVTAKDRSTQTLQQVLLHAASVAERLGQPDG